MRPLYLWSLLYLSSFPSLSSANTVPITDIPIYSSLAGCAASAVSYNVDSLTVSICPGGAVTVLQSCACSKDQNSQAVQSKISSSVIWSCGSTASEDITSASYVFSAYCNQAAAASTTSTGPAPTNTISQYITDLPAFSNLGPCATAALSYAVNAMSTSLCPTNPSALNSCVCTKNGYSLQVSDKIKTEVFNSCGPTHTEDVTSAEAIFSGYCALTSTSVFPTVSHLAGDVTYYITDLPSYSSLATCAQSAVWYPIYSITGGYYADCPAGPKDLVSCVCVKDGNSQSVSSGIVSEVKYSCGSTASADVSSALAVLDYYCSAGKGLVTPAGVTASVTSGTTGYPGYTYETALPTSTSSSSSGLLPGTSASPNTLPVAAIAGGAAGGVVFILFMLFVGWKFRRRHPNTSTFPPTLTNPGPNANNETGPGFKAELASTPISPTKGVLRKPVPTIAVSTVSPIEEEKPPELETIAQRHARLTSELEAAAEWARTRRTVELGGPEAQELGGRQQLPPEAPGSTQYPSELGGMSANMNEGPWEMDAHGWHGGP